MKHPTKNQTRDTRTHAERRHDRRAALKARKAKHKEWKRLKIETGIDSYEIPF